MAQHSHVIMPQRANRQQETPSTEVTISSRFWCSWPTARLGTSRRYTPGAAPNLPCSLRRRILPPHAWRIPTGSPGAYPPPPHFWRTLTSSPGVYLPPPHNSGTESSRVRGVRCEVGGPRCEVRESVPAAENSPPQPSSRGFCAAAQLPKILRRSPAPEDSASQSTSRGFCVAAQLPAILRLEFLANGSLEHFSTAARVFAAVFSAKSSSLGARAQGGR